jgi:hypothetical protein
MASRAKALAVVFAVGLAFVAAPATALGAKAALELNAKARAPEVLPPVSAPDGLDRRICRGPTSGMLFFDPRQPSHGAIEQVYEVYGVKLAPMCEQEYPVYGFFPLSPPPFSKAPPLAFDT